MNRAIRANQNVFKPADKVNRSCPKSTAKVKATRPRLLLSIRSIRPAYLIYHIPHQKWKYKIGEGVDGAEGVIFRSINRKVL